MTLMTNRRMAAYVGIAALATIAGVGVAWQHHQAGVLPVDVMDAFWSSEFETPSGEVMLMSSFKGHPLVINFWATWCTPCVEEMPLIDSFFSENKHKNWQVIGLAIDQPSRVRQFLSQFPVQYPIGLAGLSGTALAKRLGNEVGGLPFTVVFDAEGRLIHRKVGKLTANEIKNWAE